MQGYLFLLMVRCYFVKLVTFFVELLNIDALAGVTSHVTYLFTRWHGAL